MKIDFDQYLYDCTDTPAADPLGHHCRGPRNKNLVYQVFMGSFVDPSLEVYKGYVFTDALVSVGHWQDEEPVTFYFPPVDPSNEDYQDYKKCWLFFVRTDFPDEYTSAQVLDSLNWDVDYYITHMRSVVKGLDIIYEDSKTPFYDISVDDISFDPNMFFYRLLFSDKNKTVTGAEPIDLEDLSVIYKNRGGLRSIGSDVIITYKINGDSLSTSGLENQGVEDVDPDSILTVSHIGLLGFPRDAEIIGGIIHGTLRIHIISKWTFVKERDQYGLPVEYAYYNIYGEDLSNNDRTFDINWRRPSWQSFTPDVSLVGTSFFDAINSELPRPNPHNYIYMRANATNHCALKVHNNADVPILNVSFDFTFEKRNLKRETISDEWLPLENGEQNHIAYTEHVYRIEPYQTVDVDLTMIKYRYIGNTSFYKRLEDIDPSEWRIQCKVSFSWVCDSLGTLQKAAYDQSQHYLEAKMIFLEDEKLTNYGYPRAYVDALQENFYNIDGGDAILSQTMGKWCPPENGLPIHLNAGVDFPSDSPTNEKKTFLVSRGYVDYDAARNAIHSFCDEDNGEFIYQGISDYSIGQDVYLYSIINNSYRNSGVPIGKTMLTNDCELHFEDRSVEGYPINPLRPSGMGNVDGITMVDYQPPVIDNVKIMRQNYQYFNVPSITLNDNSNNIIDAQEYPQIDIVVNCYDYMTSADVASDKRKAPYSVGYRLINLETGNVVESNTCEFSSVHDKNVLRLYTSESNESNFEYVLTNNYQTSSSGSGMDGCINTAALLNGSYRLFIEAKDNIPLKDSLSYFITIQNGALPLPDEIEEDTTISGVYNLVHDVSIVNGAILTINPGTKLYINNDKKIYIENGALIANGTMDNKIMFTAVNEGSYWGGIRCRGDSTTITMHYCEISNAKNEFEADYQYYNDESNNKGGALYLGNPDYSQIENCEFTNCIADSGGVAYIGNANTSFINNKFFGNRADMGGALYVNGSYTNIIGNYFYGNTAMQGSAVYFDQSGDYSMVYNNTIVNNTASVCGTIYANYSRLDMLNDLLWGNVSNPYGAEVLVTRQSGDNEISVWFRNCNIQNYPQAIQAPEGAILSEDCISINPLCVPNAEFGYMLNANSPCINAGLATTESLFLPIHDLMGNSRFDDYTHRIDIGAYEKPLNQTHITWTDDITSDTVWSADTVYVANTITVQDSTVLIVNPGVRVVIDSGASLIVNGTLKTMGTAEQHVVFMPDSSPGSWGKIIMHQSTASYQKHNPQADKIKVTSRPDATANQKYSSYTECLYTDFIKYPNSVLSDSLLGVVLELDNNYDARFNNCCFEGGHRGNGGAVLLSNSFPQFTDCSFDSCSSVNGGAVYADCSYPLFKNCTFTGNTATNGGALYSSFSTQYVQGSIFADNTAENGGVVFGIVNNLVMINNTIADNYADKGGALYATNGSVLWGVNDIVYSNAATEGSQLYIDNEMPTGSPVYDSIGVAVDMAYCDIEGGAGAFWYSDSTATRGNSPLKQLLLSSKAGKGTHSRTEVTNTIDFAGNNIDANPALNNDYIIGYNSPCINSGSGQGFDFNSYCIDEELLGYTAIANRYDMGTKELAVQESVDLCGTITQNLTVFATTVNITGSLSIPAGVTVTIDSTTTAIYISGNYQIGIAGSLIIRGRYEKTSIGTTGTSAWKGFCLTGSGKLSLLNCKVYNVSYTGKGAILCNYNSELNVAGCEFYNNTNTGGKGGAVTVGTVTNIAMSRISIQNSYFHDNAAGTGGALYLAYSRSITIDNCLFKSNTASEKGGAIALGDTVTVRNCQILDNHATQGGGGVYFVGGAGLLLNCTVMDNATSGYGGGLYFSPTPDPKEHSGVINTIVWNNTCPGDTTKNVYGLAITENSTRYYAYSTIGGFASCRYTQAMAVNDENPLADWDNDYSLYRLRYYSPCINAAAPLPHYVPGMNRTLFAEDVNRPLSGYLYDLGAWEYLNPPDLEVTTTELNYGVVAIGDTGSQTLKITNRGYYQPLQITSISLPEGFYFGEMAERSSVASTKSITKSQNVNTLSSMRNSHITEHSRVITAKSVQYPLVVEPFETVEIPVIFDPNRAIDYTGEAVIETSAFEEPAVININAVGYDDTEVISTNTAWGPGTVRIYHNYQVQSGITLTIRDNTDIEFFNNRKISTSYGSIDFGDYLTVTSEPNFDIAGFYLETSTAESLEHATISNCKFISCGEALSLTDCGFDNVYLEHRKNSATLTDCSFADSYADFSCMGAEGSECLTITGCDFQFSPFTNLVSISSFPNYYIENNTFTNYQTALWINESGYKSTHIIKNNHIFNNQYGYGIEIYHSSTDITEANVIENNYIGVGGVRNSQIKIVGNSESPFQTIRNNIDTEMVFAADSFPFDSKYNAIYDELNPPNYLLKAVHTENVSSLKFESSFWGSDFNPSEDLYPDGLISTNPIWEPGEEVYFGYDPAKALYMSGCHNYDVTNYLLAQEQFEQVVSNYSESEFAKYAAQELINCYEALNEPLTDLQEYYLFTPELYYNSETGNLALYLANYCDIKMGDYQSAIVWFEDVLANPPTEADSIYAVIDMAYTFLLMDADNKGFRYTGKYPQYHVKNMPQYVELRESLISKLIQSTSHTVQPPQVFLTALSQNYPNPFNPTTTIRYTLERDTKCSLSIYNIKGQKVKTLLDGAQGKGNHRVVWQGKDDNGKSVASGVYFYKLDAGGKTLVRKMLMLK